VRISSTALTAKSNDFSLFWSGAGPGTLGDRSGARQTIEINRKSIEFNRTSIEFHRKSIKFDRKSIEFNKKSINLIKN